MRSSDPRPSAGPEAVNAHGLERDLLRTALPDVLDAARLTRGLSPNPLTATEQLFEGVQRLAALKRFSRREFVAAATLQSVLGTLGCSGSSFTNEHRKRQHQRHCDTRTAQEVDFKVPDLCRFEALGTKRQEVNGVVVESWEPMV